MGHKVHPKIFRIGTIYTWDSKWFAKGKAKYSELTRQDVLIREYLKTKLKEAGMDAVKIERNAKETILTLVVAKPGLIIGRGGAGIEDLRTELIKKFFKGDKKTNLKVNIQEVERQNLSAPIMVQLMANDLEKRMAFRRVLKQTIEKVRKAGALGVKVMVSGRLNGAEIARREMLVSGKLPLQNLRADIDYANVTARTIYGAIGVKIWIYRGEIFSKNK